MGTNNNNYICEGELICEDDSPYFLISNNECSTNCSASSLFTHECKINNDNIIAKQKIILDIINDIKSHSLDELLLNVTNGEKKDIILNESNIIYQITTTFNQINNDYENISTIDLGECENILKDKYNISKNESLIIFKIDYYVEGLYIPIIKYEIFDPRTKEHLDINYCEENSIKINIPVVINEDEIFKHDPSSDYYNDNCYPYTTENRTDITLYERKNEYNKKNMSLCSFECKYQGYNSKTKKALCECQIRNISLTYFFKSIINNEELIDKLLDIKNIVNIDIIKCYKTLFTKDGIMENIASYILLLIILIFIICSIIFYLKGYKFIKKKIIEIMTTKKKYMKNNTKKIKTNKKCKIKKIKGKIKNNKKGVFKSKIYSYKKGKINALETQNVKVSNNILDKNHKKSKKQKAKSIRTLKNTFINSKSGSKLIISDFKKRDKKTKNNNDNKTGKKKSRLLFNDYELNTMVYKNALIYDKRTYVEYYFSLLKTKHLIMFSFFPNNDYNSKAIKATLFFFSFALYYTVNALFFNDNLMHKIYVDNGIFKLVYQINQIFYSSIISFALTEFIKYLALSEKHVIKIKRENNIKCIDSLAKSELNCLKIKFILFFIITFLLLLYFWYYLGCFCAVYRNTQLYLIKDTAISFGLSLIYPLLIYLLPGIFRIPSLKKRNRECIYKISRIIQII